LCIMKGAMVRGEPFPLVGEIKKNNTQGFELKYRIQAMGGRDSFGESGEKAVSIRRRKDSKKGKATWSMGAPCTHGKYNCVPTVRGESNRTKIPAAAYSVRSSFPGKKRAVPKSLHRVLRITRRKERKRGNGWKRSMKSCCDKGGKKSSTAKRPPKQ